MLGTEVQHEQDLHVASIVQQERYYYQNAIQCANYATEKEEQKTLWWHVRET